jgi:hypothetical protein
VHHPTQLVPDAGVVVALLVLSAVCRTAEEVRKNIECNALSAVDVTHHFLKRMVRGTHWQASSTPDNEGSVSVTLHTVWQPCRAAAAESVSAMLQQQCATCL